MEAQILEKLGWRYAVKQFDSSKKLSETQIGFVKETLRLSPSSFGLQPWHFVFVENKETRSRIREKAWNQSQIEDASHLIVLCTPKTIGVPDIDRLIKKTAEVREMPEEALDGYSNVIKGFTTKFSEEQRINWMARQLYVALGTLLTACSIAGIDACPMEGFEPEGINEILGLSQKGLVPTVLCTLGVRSEEDKYASLKKVRYELNDIITTV